MKQQGTLIIACLASAAAGVVIGMLIAPESGEKLRDNVKKFASNFMDKIADQAEAADHEAKAIGATAASKLKSN